MEYRKLGNTGLKVSALSLGSWITFSDQLDDKEVLNHMALAFDNGINLFDNAEAYGFGKAETKMGTAIKKLKWTRDSFIITSKVLFGGDKPTQKGLNKSILLEPDERIVEKSHEETIESFVHRLESFIKSRTNSQGPFILATHGHVIECMLLTRLSAPYILNEKIDGHIGIKGIHGVANGSVSALVDSTFVFFNRTP